MNIFVITVWKVSKYGVFSGPYFTVFEPEKTEFTQWIFFSKSLKPSYFQSERTFQIICEV